MGTVVSRWKAKPSTVEILEGIEKDIKHLEEFREKNQRLLKLWVGRLLLYSSLLYLITCVTVYLWCLPEEWTGRLIWALPFFTFPILVWFMRKLLIFLFSKRTERNNEKLEDLKSQKRKILEEVMETETYKNAKLILERFDPESRKKDHESTPAGPQMTPRPGQEVRQRNIPRTPAMGTPSGPPHPPATPGSTPSGPPLHSAPGGPPEKHLSAMAAQQSLMRRPMSPGTPIPGVGLHPPGPPLARPILPRERGAMDRVIEYLVGDGPQNRYALICQQCCSHNGMALKEEFEYVAFRCAYCYFLNPARKTRPQAPRLPEFSFERRERSDSATPGPSATPAGSDTDDAPDEDQQEGTPSAETEPQSGEQQPAEEEGEAPEEERPGTPESEKAPAEQSEETPSEKPQTTPPEKSDEEQEVPQTQIE
ncbi:endoplasmic reticulum junction formation protein lunapark-B-like isoform X2 [Megalops cyprinoides]|uniref:endoplasmic reticulum junction formation protein lunapark-B-like isoform X2 n=1 Tax=Megalops cyprinoides TaxID=118141 RepID=UPI001863CACF|nr:endoplasmic reticulum junction formation protein lunapark-B-like isoform X2 [Megalops cyprinoides]